MSAPRDTLPSLRNALPSREWYTNPERHRRTALTPDWPRWKGEDSVCPRRGCKGLRTTNKRGPNDIGFAVAVIEGEQGAIGAWVCLAPGCGATGWIYAGEIDHGPLKPEPTDQLSLLEAS